MKFSDQFEERCEDWEGLVVVPTKSGWVWITPSDDDSDDDDEEEDNDGYDHGVGFAADQTTPSYDGDGLVGDEIDDEMRFDYDDTSGDDGLGGDNSAIMMILVVLIMMMVWATPSDDDIGGDEMIMMMLVLMFLCCWDVGL